MKLTDLLSSSAFAACFLAAVVAIAPVNLRAAAPGAEKVPGSAYEQAVAAYIDGATKEVAAYRSQIEAVKDPEQAKRYTAAREKLAGCEAILDQLKTAPRGRFDPLKAEYERGRAQLLQQLEAARKP